MLTVLICLLKIFFICAIIVGVANLIAFLIIKLFPLLTDLLIWVVGLLVVVAICVLLLFLSL